MTRTYETDSGPDRFTPRLGPDADPPGRGRAAGGAAALLVLVVVVPLVLLRLAPPGDVLASWPGPAAVGERVPVNQVLAVLVVVAWAAWLQFAVCVVVEAVATLRDGGPAPAVPLSGPSQRLARSLVASVLVAGAVAAPATAALAAPLTAPPVARPSVAAAASAPVAGPANETAPQSPAHPAAEESVTIGDDESEFDGLKVYVVRAPAGRHHDSLWAIAERYLGDGRRYPEILRLNAGRQQPDGDHLELARLIRPGWRLIMPADAVGVPVFRAPTSHAPASRAHASRTPAHPAEKPSPAIGDAISTTANDTATNDGGGPRDPETSWDMDGSRAELLIGGGLLAATLLGLLLLVRRRRGGRPPQPPAVEAEEFLRAGAPTDRGDLLDTALRSITGCCTAAGVALPPVRGAVVGADGVDLLLAMPRAAAPPPWRDVDGGSRWRLRASDRDRLEPAGGSAYPLLASVGRDDDGRDVLLDLGAAGGPVTVLGSPAMAAAVVRAVALGLAGSSWSRGIEVLTCDLPPGLPTIAAGRLTACPGAEELTDRLEQTRRRPPANDPAPVLTGGPPPGARRERVAVFGAALSPGLGRRVGALGGHGDVAVLVTGELDAARWRLRVDDTGRLECEELSLAVTAHRLGHGSIDRLHSLFVAAAQPPTRPATGDGRPPAPPPPPVETDDVTWARATCRIALLGEVEVRAEGPLEPGRTASAGEVVAYLSLHPAGVHPTVLGSALWPAGVPADVLGATVEQARAWLGTDPDGRFRVRTGHDGRLRLSPGVVSDWDVLRTLLARARRAPAVARERDLLVRALHLVRGPVAGGAPPVPGSYSWLARTGLEHQAGDLVVDAADRLSRICLDEGDQVGVAQASAAGLRARPCAQQLWRNILRAEHALGGAPRLDVAVEHLGAALAAEGVDLEATTQALIDHLRGTSTQGASTRP